MKTNNAILIAMKNNDIYLKPLGHVTASLSFPVREMIFKKLNRFHAIFNIFVDLSETDYMDSTFLGLMVGIDKRLYSHLKTHLYVLNPNEISFKLLRNMGLHKFLNILRKKIPENICFSLFDDKVKIDEIEKTRIVLSTHKDLIYLSEANKRRFKTLAEVLERKLKEKK